MPLQRLRSKLDAEREIRLKAAITALLVTGTSANTTSTRRKTPKAYAALERMHQEGLLSGSAGLLRGRHLSRVNLSNMRLDSTNFTRANLWNANLSGADLSKCWFQMADMDHTVLVGANLSGADLFNAWLRNANLTHANLTHANLSGCNLRHANLSGAILLGADMTFAAIEGVQYSTSTVLPDARSRGKGKDGYIAYDRYWTPDTDMSRYTNPAHPDYWQTQRKKG